ncbi:TPA: hypothetical protein ACH3X3_007945 [Trebouxia sp. C0006]
MTMIPATKLLVFVLLASSLVEGSIESLSRPAHLANLANRLPFRRRLSQFHGSGGGPSAPTEQAPSRSTPTEQAPSRSTATEAAPTGNTPEAVPATPATLANADSPPPTNPASAASPPPQTGKSFFISSA